MTRQQVYRFMELPHIRQLRILKKLSLTHGIEPHQTRAEMLALLRFVMTRIKERNLIKQFVEATQLETEDMKR